MSKRQCIQSALVVWGLLSVAFVSGCGDGPFPPPPPVLSIQLAPTNSGDGQTDTVGGALANALRVLVLRDQTPVSGAVVSWTVNVGSVSPRSTTTDVSGIAQAIWTLGDTVGAQVATASLPADTAVNDTVPLHVSFSAIARPGAPTALVFRPGPSNAFVGRPLIPVVRVAAVDRLGTVATDFRGPVTVALGTAPSGASLAGATAVGAVDGVAAFTDLSLDRTGVGYTLTASAGGLAGVTSAAFKIVTPGSDQIAFLSARDGNEEIYVMNEDGSGQVNLTNNPGSDRGPAWSPDGTRIAFVSNRDGNSEIYVMHSDGSGLLNLTNNPGMGYSTGTDYFPVWSPDGTRIAFVSNRDGNWEIYVLNADGSGLHNLTNNPAVDGSGGAFTGVGLAWSPDGARIAFSSGRDGNDEIYVMNADGSDQLNLTNNPGTDYSPVWSPDGTRIAFFRLGYNNSFAIYVMNANGSGVTQIGTTSLYSVLVWSPDGSKIAYRVWVNCRCPRSYILVMNADGSGVTQLTNTGNAPVWSPDGTRIAFDSRRDGNHEIYVMHADGSGQVNLTNNPGYDVRPAWKPR